MQTFLLAHWFSFFTVSWKHFPATNYSCVTFCWFSQLIFFFFFLMSDWNFCGSFFFLVGKKYQEAQLQRQLYQCLWAFILFRFAPGQKTHCLFFSTYLIGLWSHLTLAVYFALTNPTWTPKNSQEFSVISCT